MTREAIMIGFTRAVISEKKDGKFQVSILVRIGRDTWRDSRNNKPRTFHDRHLAEQYGKTFGEVI